MQSLAKKILSCTLTLLITNPGTDNCIYSPVLQLNQHLLHNGSIDNHGDNRLIVAM